MCENLMDPNSDTDWARRCAETIVGEDVISFLSRKAVIPKYGFPVWWN